MKFFLLAVVILLITGEGYSHCKLHANLMKNVVRAASGAKLSVDMLPAFVRNFIKAGRSGYPPTITKDFLNHVADADSRNFLHHAVMAKDPALVKLFLDIGTNPHHYDVTGHTPISLAQQIAEKQPSVETMQIASLLVASQYKHTVNTLDDKVSSGGWL